MLILVITVIAIVGSFLPRTYQVKSETTIDAPSDLVFANINDLTKWKNWSSFNPSLVPEIELNFSDKKSGPGATMKWRDSRGSGKLWIVSSDPKNRVVYEVKFDNFPTMTSQMELHQDGLKTKVIWTSEGELPPGPFYGFFAPLFSGQMNHEYEQCLSRLEQQLEKNLKEEKLQKSN